jgi:hypothetical protein
VSVIDAPTRISITARDILEITQNFKDTRPKAGVRMTEIERPKAQNQKTRKQTNEKQRKKRIKSKREHKISKMQEQLRACQVLPVLLISERETPNACSSSITSGKRKCAKSIWIETANGENSTY